MRLVIQRVKSGRVSVGGRALAEIGSGLVVLVGVGPDDTETQPIILAEKTANLRIFEDDAGKMNRSILETGGAVIAVSQFTLYADTRKGRRPSFIGAAAPDLARPLVERYITALRRLGVPTSSGEFGAEMLVEIANDGPVTIILDTDQ